MKGYEFINLIGSPRHMVEAIKELGTEEIPGPKSNPKILGMAEEIGLKGYTNDDTPWCGLFVACVLKRAGRNILSSWSNLRALEWSKWGRSTNVAMYGDILVFIRKGGGHVGFYVGEDPLCYHVLGGNQSNMVNITRIQKTRLHAIRRPEYNNQPESVIVRNLSPQGMISSNEA